MYGWMVPPPKEPTKNRADFEQERRDKVDWLVSEGLLKSERIKRALLKVPREDFIPRRYRDYAYQEVPLPLPGVSATISCPHSYPLFYEPLGLDRGHRFLEVGLGSGFGAAVAREVVGDEGLVVAMDIDPETYRFAKANLEKAGYPDVLVVQGDGAFGYPELQPYDRIAVTAACAEIPEPLIDQLVIGGRLIAPIIAGEGQDLMLFEKTVSGVSREVVCQVLYVNLRGHYGVVAEEEA